MSQRKPAALDDDALFSATPQPVPGVPQRTLAVSTVPPAKLYDLNFKVPAEMRRRVKDLAYQLDIKQIELFRRAMDALERELANSRNS